MATETPKKRWEIPSFRLCCQTSKLSNKSLDGQHFNNDQAVMVRLVAKWQAPNNSKTKWFSGTWVQAARDLLLPIFWLFKRR